MRHRLLALALVFALPLLTVVAATAGTGCCADKACCDNCTDC